MPDFISTDRAVIKLFIKYLTHRIQSKFFYMLLGPCVEVESHLYYKQRTMNTPETNAMPGIAHMDRV